MFPRLLSAYSLKKNSAILVVVTDVQARVTIHSAHRLPTKKIACRQKISLACQQPLVAWSEGYVRMTRQHVREGFVT